QSERADWNRCADGEALRITNQSSLVGVLQRASQLEAAEVVGTTQCQALVAVIGVVVRQSCSQRAVCVDDVQVVLGIAAVVRLCGVTQGAREAAELGRAVHE